jgi:hypothetical protein
MNNQELLKNLLIDLKNILTSNDLIFHKNLSIKNDLFVHNNLSIGEYNPDFSLYIKDSVKIDKDLHVNGNLFVKNILSSNTIQENFFKVENQNNENTGILFSFPNNLSVSFQYDFVKNYFLLFNNTANHPLDILVNNLISNEVFVNNISCNKYNNYQNCNYENKININSDVNINKDIYINGYVNSNNSKIIFNCSIESNNDLYFNNIKTNNLSILSTFNSQIINAEQLFSPFSQIEHINSNIIYAKNITVENEISVNSLDVENINSSNISSKTINTNKLVFSNEEDFPILLSKQVFVPNLNVEFLNGKTAPNSEIVGLEDEQILKNKSFGNDVNMLENRIRNVREPIDDYDVVNKKYVDMKINGINYFPMIKFAFNKINENFVFENDNLIIKEIDILTDKRILIFNQDNENFNGIYVFDKLIDDHHHFVKDADYKKVLNSRKYFHVFIEDGYYSGITFMIYFNIRKTQFSIIHNHNTFGYLMNKIVELEKQIEILSNPS